MSATDPQGTTVSRPDPMALYDYFRQTRPWKKLPVDVTRALARRLAASDASVVEEFLRESVGNNLVRKHFIHLCKSPSDGDLTLMLFAQTMYNYGSRYLQAALAQPDSRSQDFAAVAQHGMSSLRSAIAIEPAYFPAKYALAMFHRLTSDYDEALSLCAAGIGDIDRIGTSADDHLSFFERNARSIGTDELRSQFVALADELQKERTLQEERDAVTRKRQEERLKKTERLFIRAAKVLHAAYREAPAMPDAPADSLRQSTDHWETWPIRCELAAYLLFRIDLVLSRSDTQTAVRRWAQQCASHYIVMANVFPGDLDQLDHMLVVRLGQYADLMRASAAKWNKVNPDLLTASLCVSLIRKGLELRDDSREWFAFLDTPEVPAMDKNEALIAFAVMQAAGSAIQPILVEFQALIRSAHR